MLDVEHKIKSQKFEISLEKEEEAHEVQSAISSLQESSIARVIEAVFDQFSEADVIYLFNTVELDLGTIQKSNYQNELVYKIEEALIKFFNDNLLENGGLRNGKKIVVKNKLIQVFENFLLQGYLSWNSSRSVDLNQILRELLSKSKDEFTRLLFDIGKKDTVRKRLVHQFDDEALDEVVRVVAKADGDYMVSYKKQILQRQFEYHDVDTDYRTYRNSVWEIILAYLLVESNGYYNKKSFLKHLITKIAISNSISFSSFISSITKDILDQGIFTEQVEFKRILLELKNESDSTVSDQSQNKESVESWLKPFDYYIKNGVFPLGDEVLSKGEFRQRLIQSLHSNNRLIVRYINQWMSQPQSRYKFLQIVDKEVVNSLYAVVELTFIKHAISFFKVINTYQGRLSEEARAILKVVNNEKSSIVFLAFDNEVQTEKDTIYILLDVIYEQLFFQKVPFSNLLFELRTLVPNTYKTIFDSYFKTKKISKDILADTDTIQTKKMSELWDLKVDGVIEKSHFENIIAKKLLVEIKTIIHQKVESVFWITNIIRALEVYIQKFNFTIEELLTLLANETKDQEVIRSLNAVRVFHKKSKEETKTNDPKIDESRIVIYILSNISIPWWSGINTWSAFNEMFERVLHIKSNQKRVLETLAKNSTEILSKIRFTPIVHQQIWKAAYQSKPLPIVDFAIQFQALFEQKMIPSGIYHAADLHSFNKEVTRIILTSSESQILKEIELLIENLFAKVSSNQVLINNIIDLIENQTGSLIAVNTDLRQIFVKLKAQFLVKEFRIEESKIALTLSKLLLDKSKTEAEKGQVLLNQILQIKDNASNDYFVTWLSDESNRQSFVTTIRKDDLVEILRLYLNFDQQRVLEEVLGAIAMIAPQLTSSTIMIVYRELFEMLFFKLSYSNFSDWTQVDWFASLEAAITFAVGNKKKNQVIFNTLSKQNKEGAMYEYGLTSLKKLQENIIANLDDDEFSEDILEEEKPYRKLGEKEERKLLDPLFINNSGLILLAPYIAILFEKCGLMNGGEFINDESRVKGVGLLQYAATGSTAAFEPELVLNKVLCGIPVQDPLESSLEISNEEKEIVDSLLYAVTQQWPPLNGTSIQGLRETFIQRDGKIEETEEDYFLKVEQKAFDMLLDQIPWNISIIKLSWMEKMIAVEWR